MTSLLAAPHWDELSRPGLRPSGPVTGPAVMDRLRIEPPVFRSEAVADLFAAVLSATPGYLPGVASGEVTFDAWYRRKDPQWVRVAHTPAVSPGLAGHVAVRLNALLPDGRMLEEAGAPRLSWEVSMLVVRPGVRGCGVGSALVRSATTTFNRPLWASVHSDGPGCAMLTRLGWEPSAEFFWSYDPAPGVVMLSPEPAH